MRVPIPSRNEIRLPTVSATTPVGTSNTIWPALKVALTSITRKMSSPASSRKRVLTPQMIEVASVKSAPVE